jgi:hypothetical protein
MNSFEAEKQDFESAVRARAAVLIRDGYAAPYDAIEKAREQIMRERQAAARNRNKDKLQNILGGGSGEIA